MSSLQETLAYAQVKRTLKVPRAARKMSAAVPTAPDADMKPASKLVRAKNKRDVTRIPLWKPPSNNTRPPTNMHVINKNPTKSVPKQDSPELYRESFSQCGLRYGQCYGSKSGYVRENPKCFFVANSCIYTRERVCVWRGDIDLALGDIQQSLVDASRILGRKLFILREQTHNIQSWPRTWLARAALVTVWRGELTFGVSTLPDALLEKEVRRFFGSGASRKIYEAAAVVRAALRARGYYLVVVPAITAKKDQARARPLSPRQLAVLARRLATSRNKTEKDALQSEIVRGFYSKPK